MTDKEKNFYAKDFKFSYSSLNKLLFSPSLFYKDYILGEREDRTEKHLIEGKLIHCLFFEPENLNKKFKIAPGKTPTDNVRKILHRVSERSFDEPDLMSENLQELILDILKEENLYQTLKEDSARLSKIQCEDNLEYWKFINDKKVDVIDQDTLTRCQNRVEILKQNKDVIDLLDTKTSDFSLDPVEVYIEQYLETDTEEYKFGLKGFVDYYKIDNEKKIITICDLKTTSKPISDFKETVAYYNYWLQAAIYMQLVTRSLSEKSYEEYDLVFKFVVIDNYDQVYVFDVTSESALQWLEQLKIVMDVANYHYENNNYTLPYEFLVGKVSL